ncbi:MAG: malectin domain-containing carbohydrate-binding protein [Victivallaceae bacterium]|nr:malectin domain-containing carbohydrate-binding protein [Victivallaceae bacterium]
MMLTIFKRTPFVCSLLLSAAAVAGTVRIDEEFTQAPPREKMTLSRGCRVADGVLQMGARMGKSFERVQIKTPTGIPFRLSFDDRVELSDQRDAHWGVTLVGKDGRKWTFSRRETDGDATGMRMSASSGKILAKATFPDKKTVPVGKAEKMRSFELSVYPDFVEMKIDGQSLGTIPGKISELSGLEFYTYNMHVQFDSLKLQDLAQSNGSEEKQAVFYAPFDGTLGARLSDVRTVEGASTRSPVFVPGVRGQAISLRTGAAPVKFETGSLLGEAGAILFWSSPGKKALQTICFRDEQGKAVLTCRAQEFGFAIDLIRPDGTKFSPFLRGNPYLFYRNDWHHFAVTWDRTGAIRIYRNGINYIVGDSWDTTAPFFSSGTDLSRVRSIELLPSADSVIDELICYRRKVSAEEINAIYRASAPLDVVVPDSVIIPGKNAKFIMEVAPGGTYAQIRPGKKTNAKGVFSLKLYALNKKTFSEPALKEISRKIEIQDRTKKIEIPVEDLTEGDYLAQWMFQSEDNAISRGSVPLKLLPVPQGEAASDLDVAKGKLIFEKKLQPSDMATILKEGELSFPDGKYLEGGQRKGDRFGFVIDQLASVIQKPVLLEIDWPDDKPRMMGLYLYLEQKKGECYRDRLQGGIQAGREIPSSGKIQTTRYLFWPQHPTVLFEARTMANSFPAAVCAVRVYEVANARLPKLKIRKPEGLPSRAIGNCDEDQTLSTTMAANDLKMLTARLLDYMDYTGQERFDYAILRYYYSYFPYPGSNGNHLYPTFPGAMGYVVDAMHSRDKKFSAILNMNSFAEIRFATAMEKEIRANGFSMLNKDDAGSEEHANNPQTRPNPANPQMRQAFLNYIRDFSSVLSRPGMQGLALWDLIGWNKLEEGYDNDTVRLFSRQTKINVPPNDPFGFLTSEKILPIWSKWRAEQILLQIKGIRELIDTINPALPIYVMKRRDTDWESYLDKMLKSVKGVSSCDFRRPTTYRHAFHWGAPENDLEEKNYDFKQTQAIKEQKSNEYLSLFYAYYETFHKSLDRKNFGCYFQSADVKPHGRHFLKELAFDVAAYDILDLTMGGQPFGSWGREVETREFARAFAALPRQNFETVPANGNHSACVRFLPTGKGTYFYAINLTWKDAQITPDFAKEISSAIDLSTGKEQSTKNILLKPYELRSFFLAGRKNTIKSYQIQFDPELKKYCTRLVQERRGVAQYLRNKGIPVDREFNLISLAEKALAMQDYAETHRIIWSMALNNMMEKRKSVDMAVKEAQMIRQGIFAINCGSSAYHTTADGKLFFPDIRYREDSAYGHFGSHKTAMRKLGKAVDLLYQTEAWDLDGYQFKLPNGTYRIRLYLKVGWPDDFKEGKVVFSVFAQGKALFANKDLHKAMNNNFDHPLILDFSGVKVENGQLSLRFEQKKGLGGNIRLCNAIEVAPEKKE